ncbi:RNA-directed RNA polymerase [ssRNA phage Esthiorhiza.2_38]|uniref:RNA-directed RNA polymerase n=2 Tax=Fiersviridae TaxID=2842319 RepID=A0A8S5KYX9_9VIRU|nr:RNA-directed RNA polymerase [ssRNA phage Esthiorhiza.2_38]QDH87736.1 MAG: RNA-dependent RNA polymerase [Leviviridae sp.]DAD50395.1 TPA_asm: RNA-directed RNA polymerase [ssRNA phage Esthiorhiza.2_38]
MSSKKYGTGFLKKLVAFRVSPGLTPRLIERHLEALNCPRALAAWMLFKYGEHLQLSQLAFDPLHYNSLEELRDAYAATKLLSKSTFLRTGLDLEQEAMQKFDKFELLCRQTNLRFRDLSTDPLFKGPVVWLHNAVIRKIDRILGEFSTSEFFSNPDWGPGASTLIKRRFASSANKFQLETGITRDLLDIVPLALLKEVYPLWGRHLEENGFPAIQVGNRIVTVPKDAKEDRVIAIEPGLNIWFQLSIGKMISQRLRRFGIDLRYQDRNQELARSGSITNELATVDLSSASDSIAASVAEALLPPRWFAIMNACRSRCGVQNDRLVRWEKFSSMGNGFTFPFESLVFFAVASSCAEYLGAREGVSVYGDDVILPSTCFALFSEMMDFYGFRINLRKSFSNSLFRESCGSHFFSGSDVKPIYLKDRLSSVQSVYRAANAVRRFAHRRQFYGCDSKFRLVFELLVKSVPKALRLRIPDSLGDGGFISNFDEATPVKARHWVEGYFVTNLTEVSKTYQEDRLGYLLASLWRLPEREGSEDSSRNRPRLEAIAEPMSDVVKTILDRERNREIASLSSGVPTLGRNSVPIVGNLKVRAARSLVHRWEDLGPWI